MSRKEQTTPAWVEQLNEDVIMKDTEDTSWFTGGYLGMPTRYHSEGGYINAYDTGYHKYHHDETSLRSRSTVSSRTKRRRNSCCLALFLIFAALLVAIGIGLMVYYLMRPDPMKYQLRLANGSLPLLNVPYIQEMKDTESQTFKNMESSLCEKIATFFKGSVYENQYESCKIQYLRLDDTPLPCACSNITGTNDLDNVRAYINLMFHGDVNRLMIHTIIENHLRRVVGLDYDVLLLDDFIVDIESRKIVTTPTAKPIPDVGVRANLIIWVYNLTYNSDLQDPDSYSFRKLAAPFCSDLRRIFLRSHLGLRFYSCQVRNISSSPDVVFTDVWFTDDEVDGLEVSIKQIVLDNARKVNVSGQTRKIIGTLLITPVSGNDATINVTIPLNPETTIAPTPSTRPPNWKDGMPYVELVLNFTGVDNNISFWDINSNVFRYHADKFCKDLERMIYQSSWKQKYYECNLLNMYPPNYGEIYPSLRTVLHVTSNTNDPSELIDIIKEKADKYIFPGNLETYKIGNLYVILLDGQFNIYTTIYETDTTVVVQTSSMVFPSVFTSYSFSTPSQTPGDTVLPPVSTIVITYNATAAFIESRLIDFDYTQDLQDTTSTKFLLLQQEFCNDIDGYFVSSSLQRYYETCRILSFSSDSRFSFVLHFTAPKGEYLQTAVPSIIIQKAPKAQIGSFTVLDIGGLNLLYDAIGFTVSATNYTHDRTPSLTTSITMTSTILPPIYSASLINIFCDVASEIKPEYGDRNSDMFRAKQTEFCKDISNIFSLDLRTAGIYLDCYILEFSLKNSTVQFHALFAEDATENFGKIVVDMLHLLADSVMYEQSYHLDIGSIIIEPYSCRMNVYPVNYTDPRTTLFTTLTPTSQIPLPTAGLQHCLRKPCQNGGICMETMDFYRCTCKPGFTGHDCEIDIDECKTELSACENGGTCRNNPGGYDCTCFSGYIGDRCETVVDRCASNPCKNGATCTGSLLQLCICSTGWTGATCEQDVNECYLVPSVCKFNGTCLNQVGSFKCQCVDGRTGPTCNEGIDECALFEPCRNGATCLDTDYLYKCVCKPGWTGINCTQDVDECSEDICKHNGQCENTLGGFVCNCTSGWTGPTCNSRYDECKGANPCLHDGICIDTTSDFQCLCKEGWTGELCEIDINECQDINICNGHGVCENFDGGFRCNCTLQWEGKLCDADYDECSDTDLGQLCYNGGECINQWGSYKCDCHSNWTGPDCKTDINECLQDPPVCLHNGTCINQMGGFYCACTPGWTGNMCQLDVDECMPPSPCQNNGTCTNKVGSFLCKCHTGWRGLLCEEEIDECTESPGVCRSGGTCYNEPGGYRCVCPEGRGGKNCDYSTDPCNNILCAHNGSCYIDMNNDPKCRCTEQFKGEYCQEDFDECTLNPCVNGACRNLFGTFYCDCNVGFKGTLCDEDDNECLFYQCVHGYCNNTVGSFRCECDPGWTGQFCNLDVSECSLLENPCNGNGRCEEMPGSYKCVCYVGYEGQFCQDDFDECSQIQCENGGVCNNFDGGYQCNCTQFWTGPFCTIDLNECTTLENPCLNGGSCENKEFGYSCLCPQEWQGDTCAEDVDECLESTDLCQHNGTCINKHGGFQCNCTDGYTGKLCQTDINECLLYKPCLNGAACTNMPGSYNCNCVNGYEGKNCEKDINECLGNPCKNSAVCKNFPPGDYSCECTDGWTGKNCDIEVERCPDCQNGGVCVSENDDFKCVCTFGWQGDTCLIDINECVLSMPCQHGSSCDNVPGDYNCMCLPGYTGKNCEINIDECFNNPCKFGGTCTDRVNTYVCQCPAGRTGTNCENDINECISVSTPCQHGGTCQNTDGSFTCNCTDGWQGPVCESDKDECLTVDCLHGGTCMNDIGSFHCEKCDRGWEGQLCEKDIDECTLLTGNPCKNGGMCINTMGSYKCNCTDNWMGFNCTTDVDECMEFGELSCYGNGNCTNTDGSYLCSCDVGYTGERCDKDVDECTLPTGNPCKNGGTCINNVGSYKCNCTDNWMDHNCTTDVDECMEFGELSCYGNGNCTNTDGSYLCSCDVGYTGARCDKDIDECLIVDVCRNNATCVNNDGSFTCSCLPGWEGPRCDMDVDECVGNPCENGGTCLNSVGSFECNCTGGWTGPDCSTDVNECAEVPSRCKNGGTCSNFPGTYDCECATGFDGKDCESDIDECALGVCRNIVSCLNAFGSYSCTCLSGWTGSLCDTDIDECLIVDVCRNNATCVNNDGSFTCSCLPGWEGPRCDMVGQNTFELSFETVGLTITPDLLDTQSDTFQRKQDLLCTDIQTFATQYLVPFVSCNIKTFVADPAGLTLRLAFGDNFPDQIGTSQIRDLLFEYRERLRFDDVYGIRVGDMVFKHSDYISTDVHMTKMLVNFTYSSELNDENSFAFQQYEDAFCTNVVEIMTINAVLFPNFTSCDVRGFTYDSTTNMTNVTFTFEFEWTQDADEIAANFNDYMDLNLPKIYFDGYEAALLGSFYLYIRDAPSYTRIPISYRLLDVAWLPDLGDSTSSLFINHSIPFCNEILALVQAHASFAANYRGCSVQNYSNQSPELPNVSVDFNLNVDGMTGSTAVSSELSQIIINNSPQELYNGYVGHRVSDLILYESLADYLNIDYDGWIMNFTFSLFDYSSYKPSLMNSSSPDFKAKQKAFCEGDPDSNAYGLSPYMFDSYYSTRYIRCFVHSYTFDELSVSDSLTSTVSLLFRGKEPILTGPLLDTIDQHFMKVPVGGNGDYYFIGYDLVKIKDIDAIKVNISDYLGGETTTTPLPEIADVLRMRFPLLNFTSYEDYQNTSTFLYQNSSDWFCRDMSKMFDVNIDGMLKYAGCGNMSFTEEGGQTFINFELAFHDTIQDEAQAVAQLLTVITEKAKRATLSDTTVAIVLGPFMVYQDSLQPSITNPEIFRTPSPTGSNR